MISIVQSLDAPFAGHTCSYHFLLIQVHKAREVMKKVTVIDSVWISVARKLQGE